MLTSNKKEDLFQVLLVLISVVFIHLQRHHQQRVAAMEQVRRRRFRQFVRAHRQILRRALLVRRSYVLYAIMLAVATLIGYQRKVGRPVCERVVFVNSTCVGMCMHNTRACTVHVHTRYLFSQIFQAWAGCGCRKPQDQIPHCVHTCMLISNAGSDPGLILPQRRI